MNLSRSLKAFGTAFREDADFRRLGRPPGWSMLFHYLGRWHDRRGSAMPIRNVRFVFNGARLEFALSEVYMGAFKGVFNDEEYDCSRRLARRPRRILDLGANIGFGSVYFSTLFPEADFAFVEPDPRNLPLLRRNLAQNGVEGMVIEGAVGSAAGKLALRFGANPTCSSLEGTTMHDLHRALEVDVLTVDEILRRAGWDSVDLVKIDIEGAEDALLTENNQWLAKAGAIIMEVHPNTSAERLNGHLAPYGFHLERLGSGREPVYFAGGVPEVMIGLAL